MDYSYEGATLPREATEFENVAADNRGAGRQMCDQLSDQLDKTQAMVAHLEDRLGFVLRPNVPQLRGEQVGPTPARDAAAPFVDFLSDRLRSVSLIQERLAALIDRTEV